MIQTLLIYMITTMITPGPNNLTMLYLGAEYGIKGTRKFLTASVIGLFLKTYLCGNLTMFIMDLLPQIVLYLKWVGAAYMLYLGIKMALSGWRKEKEGTYKATESTYRSGIILQILNMKSWVCCIDLFAVCVIPYISKTSLSVIILCSVAYTAIMIVASLLWGLFGNAIKNFMSAYKKPFGILMGLSLVYCAVTAVL